MHGVNNPAVGKVGSVALGAALAQMLERTYLICVCEADVIPRCSTLTHLCLERNIYGAAGRAALDAAAAQQRVMIDHPYQDSSDSTNSDSSNFFSDDEDY